MSKDRALRQKRFYPEEPPVYVILHAPSPEEPMELELDPASMGPLTADDVGTYICSATLYYSYYGTWFNPASKVQTLTWWVVQV